MARCGTTAPFIFWSNKKTPTRVYEVNMIRGSIRSKLRLCPTDLAAVSDAADAMAAVSVVAAVVAVRGVAAFAGSVAGVAAQAAVFWPD